MHEKKERQIIQLSQLYNSYLTERVSGNYVLQERLNSFLVNKPGAIHWKNSLKLSNEGSLTEHYPLCF